MTIDIRAETAKYYDLQKVPFNDIPFYVKQIPSPDANVLELGCGTGRVLLSLISHCGYIHGLEISVAMLNICQKKLEKENVPQHKVCVEIADMTDFDLARKYDLIIAPYRAFQNLERDEQIDRFFKCVKKHLAVDGSCILNVFNPSTEREALIKEWICSDGENLYSEIVFQGKRFTASERRLGVDETKYVIYPELVYRVYDGNVLEDEQVMKIAMRCYWPDSFKKLIVKNGFEITNCWGGYDNQVYGEGPELVIQFRNY
jgi:SAM-dependent methyltransferase